MARPREVHECVCRECSPASFPSGPRQSSQHLAVRFGDHKRSVEVRLDGRIVRECVEAITGPGAPNGGLVCAYRSPIHHCERCHAGLCEYSASGDVTVRED